MIKKILPLVLLLLLLVLPYGISSAADITDQELTRLEIVFNQLELNNKQQEEKLQRASILLQKSEQQILLLSEKLTKAEQLINQAQSSLQRANESFNKYEKETKNEIRKLKLQNIVLAVAVGYFATK